MLSLAEVQVFSGGVNIAPLTLASWVILRARHRRDVTSGELVVMGSLVLTYALLVVIDPPAPAWWASSADAATLIVSVGTGDYSSKQM